MASSPYTSAEYNYHNAFWNLVCNVSQSNCLSICFWEINVSLRVKKPHSVLVVLFSLRNNRNRQLKWKAMYLQALFSWTEMGYSSPVLSRVILNGHVTNRRFDTRFEVGGECLTLGWCINTCFLARNENHSRLVRVILPLVHAYRSFTLPFKFMLWEMANSDETEMSNTKINILLSL